MVETTTLLWFKRLLALSIICLFVFVGLVYHTLTNNPFDDWWFEEKLWKAQSNSDTMENSRGKMAYDLRHRVLKPKMTKKQILKLLGPPDAGQRDGLMSYNLGSWSGFRMDPDIFEIELDKSDRLIKAYWFQT